MHLDGGTREVAGGGLRRDRLAAALQGRLRLLAEAVFVGVRSERMACTINWTGLLIMLARLASS